MARPAFTVKNFAKWLESKPAKESYDYFDEATCAAAQFSRACGKHYASASNSREVTRIEVIAYGPIGERNRWTYGAALKRARAHLARTA